MNALEIGKARLPFVEIGLRPSLQARQGRRGEKAAQEKPTA
jgi:hypothetical protein